MPDSHRQTQAQERTPMRWDNCPSTLTYNEAAAMLRWDVSTLRELITEQRSMAAQGNKPDNPLPIVQRGRRVTFDADLLREWQRNEAGRGLK